MKRGEERRGKERRGEERRGERRGGGCTRKWKGIMEWQTREGIENNEMEDKRGSGG